MLVKGSMVTEMSGSLGGITAARNKGGLYFRARSTPVNPSSAAQTLVRNAFNGLVAAWNDVLTQAQRDAWAVYAANVPVTNPLGDAKTNSGQNWYIGLNTPRVQTGLTRLDDAPVVFAGATLNPVGISINTAVPTVVSVTFDDTQSWVNSTEGGLIVQVGPPQNAGINFFKGPFRLGGLIEGDSVTPPASGDTVPNPFPIAVGQRVFGRIRLSLSDGRLSAPQLVDTIVTA